MTSGGVMSSISFGIMVFIVFVVSFYITSFFVNQKENKKKFQAISLIIFIVLLFFSKSVIMPSINAWMFRSNLEEEIDNIPYIISIKKYEPEIYNLMMQEMQNEVKKGKVGNSFITKISAKYSMVIFEKKLPVASDEAVINFIKTNNKIMNELKSIDVRYCYNYLLSINVSDSIINSVTSQLNLLSALNDVIVSRSENPQEIPQLVEIQIYLDDVYNLLYQIYGDDISILEEPSDPNIDKELYCTMIIDYYRLILELDSVDASKLTRWLMKTED